MSLSSEYYLKWVKDKKIAGLTRTQAEFAEWLLTQEDMILQIGNFCVVFESIHGWMKLNRDLFYNNET